MSKLEAIDRDIARVETELKLFEAADPFYFFKPSDGSLTSDGTALLRKHLKPEDIPQFLDGQLNAFQSECSVLMVLGGNQAGKSALAAVRTFMQMTGEIPYALIGKVNPELLPKSFPQDWRVVGVDNKQLLNTVIPTYQKWVPRNYLKGGSWENSFSAEKKTLYLYKSNKVIGSLEFMTNEQKKESFQGPKKDGVVYDEQPRKDIYEENLLRFATAERLNILFAFTATQGISWATEMAQAGKDDDGNQVDYFQLCSVTNPIANLEILDEIVGKITDYDTKRMRLLGDIVSLSGLVYGKLFNKKNHVIKPFLLDKNNYIVYRGLDPHLVKATYCVEIAVDREGIEYVVGIYSNAVDTEIVKNDLAERAVARNYRLGWSLCDPSANSTIHALGNRNIFLELKRGTNAIPALFTAEKFAGSIHTGVDAIKQLLKIDEKTGKPKLFIFDIPENQELIKAFNVLERETYMNEEKKGEKDTIAEGRHDSHAALRYAHQRPMRWMPVVEDLPVYKPTDERIGY